MDKFDEPSKSTSNGDNSTSKSYEYFWDMLKEYGGKFINSIRQTASETYRTISDEEYRKICRPILTMDDCLRWLNVQRKNYPQASYFFIFYNENPAPRNENDKFSVTIAVVDENKKTIPVSTEKRGGLFSPRSQNQNIVCIVIPTGNLDMKLLKALNGNPSVLIKL